MPRAGSMLKIISGGQTGVDRAALDAARWAGLPHGGWCPLGRRAEDGPIDLKYGLHEVDSPEYWVRTERNVMEADATLILYRSVLTGGTELTSRMAENHHRHCWLVDLEKRPLPSKQQFLAWIDEFRIEILNVAGPRESSAPGIYDQAYSLLIEWFSTEARVPRQ